MERAYNMHEGNKKCFSFFGAMRQEVTVECKHLCSLNYRT